MNIKKNEHVIKEVFPGSIAEEMEMCCLQSMGRMWKMSLITGI